MSPAKPSTVTELDQGARDAADSFTATAALIEESPPRLAAALVKALAELVTIEKGESVDTGSYSYDYASLPATVKATRPVLAEHGIVALTPLVAHGNGLGVLVILLHESGESMSLGPVPFPQGRDAQATGSFATYFRRYALTAALGMAPDDGTDDDGAKAKGGLSKDDAKELVRALAENNADTAKAAWVAIAMTGDWTIPALSERFRAWVNEPKEAEASDA